MSTPGIYTTVSQQESKEQSTRHGAHPTPVISSAPYHPARVTSSAPYHPAPVISSTPYHPAPVISSTPYHPATTQGPQNQTSGHHPYVVIAHSPMHGTMCAVPVTQRSSVPFMFTAPYPPNPAAIQMPAMAASPYFFPYGNLLHFPNHPSAAQLIPQSHGSSPVATEGPSSANTPISPSVSQAQRVGSVLHSTETKVSASVAGPKSGATPARPLTQATSSVALSPSNLSPGDLQKQSVSIEVQENQVATHTTGQQFAFPLSTTSGSHHGSDGTPNMVSASLLLHSQRTRGDAPRTGNSSLEKLLQQSSQVVQLDPIYSMLQDEPHFVSFYRYFRASESSALLRMRVLTTEGTNAVKWIEITRRASHIDPTFGPVDVARILLSSNGLCKVELLFPYFKTVYTKFMPINQEEADKLLDELSPRHVLCPGLLEYKDKHTVLGYHPTHVRVLETPYLQRYDHENCPIWHIPSNLYSKSSHIVHNMCKHCKYLQNNLVRLATKACEIDPSERHSWTDPSSNRPLAYMSTSDKEERYRKLRQERTYLLNKLKVYEDRLGINPAGDAESITSIKSESGESGKEETGARKQQRQNDGTTSDEVGDDTAGTNDKGSSEAVVAHASSEAASSQSGVQPSDEKAKGLKRLSKKRSAAGSKPQPAAKKSRAVSITAEIDVSTTDSKETKSTKGRPRKHSSGKKK